MKNIAQRLAKLEGEAGIGQAAPRRFAYLEDWVFWRQSLYQAGRLVKVDGVCMAPQAGDSEAQEEADLENEATRELAIWSAGWPCYDPAFITPDKEID